MSIESLCAEAKVHIRELGADRVAEIKRRTDVELQNFKLEIEVAKMQARVDQVERDSKRRVEELEDRLDDRRNVRPRTDGVDHQGLAERYRFIIHLANMRAADGDMDGVLEALACVNE